MNLGDALAWLDRHQDLERILADRRLQTPNPERMRRLAHLIGDPQNSQPVVHLTGTNGKTSTARALSQLFMSTGLKVGTFTSPHLEKINERIMVGLEPVSDEDLAEVLSDLAGLETLMGEVGRPTWFELLTAAAFPLFRRPARGCSRRRSRHGGPLGRHEHRRRRRLDRHQRGPGPHRAARADPGAHRRGKGGHRQARGHPGAG